MDYIWNPRGPIEAGIDGIIEVCDPNTGAALNSIIQVQSKATRYVALKCPKSRRIGTDIPGIRNNRAVH